YLEGNIIYDIESLTRNVTAAIVTYTNNILPIPWTGPGGGNSVTNPMFKHVPTLAETVFTNWAQAQVMWDWLSLQTNSAGIGTGPNGRDKGAVIPRGVYLSGAPIGETTQTNATLIVGINRTGSGIPTTGFPLGSGYTHYKWRLDTNAWSAETPINTPITVNNLRLGPHYVEVVGKNDAGWYQDDPAFGADAIVTRSGTWQVISSLRITRIAETGPNSVELDFNADANTGYTIQYRDSLSSGQWQPLVHLDPISSPHTVAFPDSIPPGTPSRFYRLSSP
ncbi:MAG TPA: hypothetical protein VNM37_20850, partial [Candidatus Dormibacteraeota bacterium]|nr:hypothetical protein [Candidatus Dormibacteraeota bacterium]